MSYNATAEEAVGVRSKAAAMLGMPMPGTLKMAMPMPGSGGAGNPGFASGAGMKGGSDSVLNNAKSEGMVSSGGGLGTASTPDLFSFTFSIELKGQNVVVEVGGSSLMSEVYEKALVMFGEKLKKDAQDRVFFFKETSIYLPQSRRADSFLIVPDIGDVIELELKKKDKKASPIVVIVDGSKTETVEINPNTTVLGVIQLLPRKNLDDDYLALWNKKGKIDWMAKVASIIKKEEALECKLDAELKSAGGIGLGMGISSGISSITSASKKKNRKSMAPSSSLKGISSSGTPGSASGSPLSRSPSMTPSSSASSLHKDKDKKNLERLLTNRPSEADLKKKNIIVDFKTDTKAAAPAAVDANSALPLQLSLFMQLGANLKRYLDLVGLFRVSGDVEEVKSFYQSMFGPNPKINWHSSSHDPHIASSALKLYLRKQADPLIPFSLYQDFMVAQKTEDDETQLQLIKSAIERMPQPNGSILHYLIHLLTMVAAHEPSNKMNPINIGIVFGPTIMWDPKPNVMDYSSTGYQSNLVTNMIDHYDVLWTTPAPSDESLGESSESGAESGNGPSNTGAASIANANAAVGHSSSPLVAETATLNGVSDISHATPSPSISASSSFSDLPPPSVSAASNPTQLEPSRSDNALGGRPTPGSFRPTPPPANTVAPPKRMPPKHPPGGGPGPIAGAGGSAGGHNFTSSPSVAPPSGSSPPGSLVGVAASSPPNPLASLASSNPPDALQSRSSFRKSLPPNMAPPIAPSTSSGGLVGSNNTGSPSGSLVSVPEFGTFDSSSSPPPRSTPHGTRPSSVSSASGLGMGATSPGGGSPARVRRTSSLSSALPRFDTQLMAAEQEIRDANIPPGSFPTIGALSLEELRTYFLSQPSAEATKHLIAILTALSSK